MEVSDQYDPYCVLTTYNGSGVSVYDESGVSNSANALAEPNGDYARLNSTGDYLIIDMGAVIPGGTVVEITHNKQSGNSGSTSLLTQQSTNGSTFTNSQTYSASSSTPVLSSYTLSGDARYIRFTSNGSRDPGIDAIAFSYQLHPCDGDDGVALTDPDTDSDGIKNRKDADADGDGCFDVKEAGFTDANADNQLDGTGINASGLITGNTDGYTTPNSNYTSASNLGISTQPNNKTVVSVASTTLTVVATDVESYQWRVFNGVDWQDATGGVYGGETTATLTLTNIDYAYNNFKYCVLIDNSNNVCGPISSDTITLTVQDYSLTPGSIGSDATYCSTDDPVALVSLSLASTIETSTITYQWQSSTDNVNFVNISGATSITYDPSPIAVTTYFRRAANADFIGTTYDKTEYSNTVTLTSDAGVPPDQPGAISGNTTICTVETISYSISAVAGATGYTWTVPSGWTINSGQNTTSITVTTASSAETTISVTADNSCVSSTARELTITYDATAPDVTCHADVAVEANNAGCTYLHAGTDWNGSATDDCDVTVTYDLTGVTTASGLSTLDAVTFNEGVTTVQLNAVDEFGNTNSCTFNVSVSQLEINAALVSADNDCARVGNGAKL